MSVAVTETGPVSSTARRSPTDAVERSRVVGDAFDRFIRDADGTMWQGNGASQPTQIVFGGGGGGFVAPSHPWAGDVLGGSGPTVPSYGLADDPNTGFGKITGITNDGLLSILSKGNYVGDIGYDQTSGVFSIYARAVPGFNRFLLQSGGAMVMISGSGHYEIEGPTGAITMTPYVMGTANGDTLIFITDGSTSPQCPVAFKQAAGTSTDLTQWRTSDNVVRSRVKSDGNFEIRSSIKLDTVTIQDFGGLFYTGTAGIWSNGDCRFGSYLQIAKIGAPGGSVNTARLFAKDNGTGKIQLCVIFPTGAVQILATEP